MAADAIPRPRARPGVLERVRALHDRIVADPRFQAFAQTFPLTRPIARRRAKALFDLSAGFIHSQVLLACLRLGLLDLLREGPLPAETIARRTGLPPESARRLLEAASGLGLLRRRGEGYGLGGLGAALLGNPAAAAMIEHHPLLYGDLADPVAAFARGRGGGRLARYWAYGEEGEPGELNADRTGAYTDLMAASQPMVARQVLDAYPVARHRRLLDIGGGSGAFLAAAAARAPGLELALFDLPAVAERARAQFEADGIASRVDLHGGDFRLDPLPPGADLITLVRIVHDHDDDAVRALLARIRASIAPGGRLLVAEPMAGSRLPGTLDTYFAVYLHALGQGRLRTPRELAGMLGEAGFRRVRRLRTGMPLLTGLLVAQAD